jgi:hypothetical protein
VQETVSEQEPVRGSEWLALLALAAIFVAIRLPLYTNPGLLLGWNSDAALLGLMARAIREGSDFPIFFWGQFYLGTLTPMVAAAIADLLRTDHIGPLILRVATSIQLMIAFGFFWAALRRMFGRNAALLATCWLVAGPVFLFHFTIAPLAVESLLLVSSVLFWFFTRMQFRRASEWLVPGLLCGLGMWLHQGIIFVIAGIALALLTKRVAVSLRSLGVLAIGAAIGYIPAFVSLLRDDPLLYKRALLTWSVPHVVTRITQTVTSDLWLLLADASPFGIAIGISLLGLAVVGFLRAPRSLPVLAALWTVVISMAFWMFTLYPYPGAVRYIAPVVPLVYGAAAFALLRASRNVAGALAILVMVGLYGPRVAQVDDVVAARSERYTNWPGDFDPRPTLAEIREGGYRVCYGEVWVAHKLEWLSEPTVRFVPIQSVHRTLLQSMRLIQEPGDKCHVDNDGNVRRLSAAEEAHWAASVRLRAQKAGLTGGAGGSGVWHKLPAP